MSILTGSNRTVLAEELQTARSLRTLYFLRAAFSIVWVFLISASAKNNPGLANILFIIYPAWDAVATYLDIRANPRHVSATPQYVNIVVGIATTIGVALALHKGVPEAIIVFGGWAILAGLFQLILGLRRRKQMGGQWPMILSGSQSVLAGVAFILLAHSPNKGIDSVAGYAAFGAFYFLVAAILLSLRLRRSHAGGQ